jgi:outer membrane autotransporter protein
VNPQTKSLSEGQLAGLSLLTMGGDLASGQGMASLCTLSPLSGWAAFGAMSGSASRYNTGSHINVNGINGLFGIGRRFVGAPGFFQTGVFFETGYGDYSTHNSFANRASVRGDGDSHYYGGGLLARFDLTTSFLSGLYTEGSFRLGHMENQWKSHDLMDAAGRRASYDTSASYYGAHFGLGYILPLGESTSLDLYGKYSWTRQDGDTASVVGDPFSFDEITSQRLRLGGKVNHTFSERVVSYVGAAWEHEFDGKARATTYGYDVPAPSLKGDTGIFELGMSFKPAADSGLSFDLAAQGYTGIRSGIGGSLQVKYTF